MEVDGRILQSSVSQSHSSKSLEITFRAVTLKGETHHNTHTHTRIKFPTLCTRRGSTVSILIMMNMSLRKASSQLASRMVVAVGNSQPSVYRAAAYSQSAVVNGAARDKLLAIMEEYRDEK